MEATVAQLAAARQLQYRPQSARILHEIESLARDCKLRTLRLETNKSLLEAHALYRSSGYAEVPAFNDEPYGHHWFQKRLR